MVPSFSNRSSENGGGTAAYRNESNVKTRMPTCVSRALDVGGVEIGLNAEDPAAPLLLRADKTAGQPAALAYRVDGGAIANKSECFVSAINEEEGIKGGAEVLFAPTVATLEADIDAGPVLDRRRNGSRWWRFSQYISCQSTLR